ncbi:MAG TPA: hypothetical protein VK189_05755 [Thermoplasmata archaeon]|nr:hypothetical protein [Thermoplasmata archaeon]
MFGHKSTGPQETVQRSQAHDDAAKSTRTRQKTETWMTKTPIEAVARKEMYFAVASTFRWSQ